MAVGKEGRLKFDSNGRIISIDNADVGELGGNEYLGKDGLKKSSDLDFLKDEIEIEEIKNENEWSLYEDGKFLDEMTYSNGKKQSDIVREVIELIGKGKKIIFLHGVCGTGKSAIALNIARELGRTSIVVPVKALQRQYEEDYMGKKYVLKKNGRKMKIAMITGRDNHDSIIKPGVSCSDPFLPDTIRFTEKNAELIKEYYDENPFIKNKMDISDIRRLKRISIAPANPYWSPIINAERDLKQISDANKRKYKGLNGKEFIFYHRKKGCSYFDQYQAYMDADVLIFNSANTK